MDYIELEEKAGRALQYLEDTEEEYALVKSRNSILSEHRKVVRAVCFANSEETTVAAREQDSYLQAEYKEHLKLMEKTDAEYILIHTRRQRALTTIELYRTISANHRR